MISVIVPIYNVAKYLPKCIESICRQTYKNIQIILIDDGSTDQSGQIAKSYAEKEKRIIYLRQTNAGPSVARNTGMKIATGKYITFVDADDYLDDDYLETLSRYINNYDIVQCGYRRVSDSGNVIKVNIPNSKYKLVSPWAKLINRDFLQKNDINFVTRQRYEDVLFSVDMWLSHPNIHVISYIGYNYTKNDASYTAITHDTRELFKLLKKRFTGADYLGKVIILYTSLRLKMHFIFRKR